MNDCGLWAKFRDGDYGMRPALFLDRDGVVVVEVGYLSRPEDMRLLPGAGAAVARCNRLGIPVVLVTNQSGIGRGYYGWPQFHAVQQRLDDALAEAGAYFDGVLACAYHPDAREPYKATHHPWRKPEPGMIREAGSKMRLDLPRSWIIGDNLTDLKAGRAAGLAGGTLVGGKTEADIAALATDKDFAVAIGLSLEVSVERLLAQGQLKPLLR